MTKRYLSVLVLLLIIVLLLVSLPAYNLWWDEAFNSGHTVLFLFFTFLLFQQLKIQYRQLKTPALFVRVFIFSALAGVLIEALQGLVNREPSVADLVSNVYGVLAGLCLAAMFNINEERGVGFRRVLFASGSLFFFLLGIASLLQLSWHYVARDSAFPVVLDFDENWSSSFLRYHNSRLLDVSNRLDSTEDGLHLMQFDSGQYPGVAIVEPEPDWSCYSGLRFSILSRSNKVIELVLRVHDKAHNQRFGDRYNEVLLVHPGSNEYVISLDEIMHGPVKRTLDLTQVSGLKLFAVNIEEAVQLEISKLFLE